VPLDLEGRIAPHGAPLDAGRPEIVEPDVLAGRVVGEELGTVDPSAL